MEKFDLDFKLENLVVLLNKEDLDINACTHLLEECILAKGYKKVLAKVFKKDIFGISTFWLINVQTLTIPSTECRILLQSIQVQEQEFSSYFQFLSSLSKFEIIQVCASFIEKNNAFLKYKGGWHERNTNDSGEELEVSRQGRTTALIGSSMEFILKRIWLLLKDVPRTKKAVSKKESNQIEECFNCVSILTKLYGMLEYFLSGYCNLVSIGSNSIRVEPKNQKMEKRIKANGIGLFKNRALINAGRGKADPERLLAITANIRARCLRMYKKVKPVGQDVDKFKRACIVANRSAKGFYHEVTHFYDVYFDKNAPKVLSLDSGLEIPFHEIFNVAAFIKALTETYIEAIDKEFINGANGYGDRLEAEDPYLRRVQEEVRQLKGQRKRINERTDYLLNKDVKFQNYLKKVIQGAKDSVPDKYCLLRYELNDIVEFIHWGTGVSSEHIEEILSIFTFDVKSPVRSVFTPFFRIENMICWLPNAVAFNNFGENLIEVIIGNELTDIDKFQTELYESSLSALFKKAGYKVIDNPEDKKYKKNGDDWTDFDTLAHKDGHLFNFEVKITYARQTAFSKDVWYNSKLRKAVKKQIPRQEGIIEDDETHVRSILNLELNENIDTDKVYSYVITNSFEFDDEQIGRYKKISFLTIKILLNKWEMLMYDEPDYLRMAILKLGKQNFRIPSLYLRWARREILISNPSDYDKIRAFVLNHYVIPSNQALDNPAKLADIIDNNELFKYLENCMKMDYFKVKSAQFTIEVPYVHYYPSFNV